MTEAKIDGNVVHNDEFKFGKVTSERMSGDLRTAVAVSMKDMLGNKKAVAVRVVAV